MKSVVAIIALIIVGGGMYYAGSLQSEKAGVPKEPPIAKGSERRPVADEDTRQMTYYTARQAYGRLVLYLQEHNQFLPKAIWLGMPERSAVYRLGDSNMLSVIVGGWVFMYEDTSGKRKIAKLNCWGEVTVENSDSDISNNAVGAIQPQEWIVDDIDAHKEVIEKGGKSKSDTAGRLLMAANVTGRGVRPVWAGGAWYMPDSNSLIMVDAQSSGRRVDKRQRSPPNPAPTLVDCAALVHPTMPRGRNHDQGPAASAHFIMPRRSLCPNNLCKTSSWIWKRSANW